MTLIKSKIVERNAFLVDPKHQYRVSECGEHDCSTQNEKNGDYNKYPSFYHFMDEH